MKVTKVTYQKVFPLAQFLNERIGVEIELSDGELPDVALTQAKEIVEQWHKEANPQLYQPIDFATLKKMHHEAPIQFFSTQPKEINIQDEQKEITIDNATSIEELASLKKDLPQNLMPAYMKKLKELTAVVK